MNVIIFCGIQAMQTHISPDANHTLNFIPEGEIRFGPAFFKVMLDGEIISGKIFGDECKWHPKSTFLALQEWLTTDYAKGPVTVLTLIDPDNKKIARISIVEKGFVKPLEFEDDTIIFKKVYLALGKTIEYEININEIENWENISFLG